MFTASPSTSSHLHCSFSRLGTTQHVCAATQSRSTLNFLQVLIFIADKRVTSSWLGCVWIRIVRLGRIGGRFCSKSKTGVELMSSSNKGEAGVSTIMCMYNKLLISQEVPIHQRSPVPRRHLYLPDLGRPQVSRRVWE